MDDFLLKIFGPTSVIWKIDVPLLEIDLDGIDPADYDEVIPLYLDMLYLCSTDGT